MERHSETESGRERENKAKDRNRQQFLKQTNVLPWLHQMNVDLDFDCGFALSQTNRFDLNWVILKCAILWNRTKHGKRGKNNVKNTKMISNISQRMIIAIRINCFFSEVDFRLSDWKTWLYLSGSLREKNWIRFGKLFRATFARQSVKNWNEFNLFKWMWPLRNNENYRFTK